MHGVIATLNDDRDPWCRAHGALGGLCRRMRLIAEPNGVVRDVAANACATSAKLSGLLLCLPMATSARESELSARVRAAESPAID
jgi:hypothetical protein